MHLSILLPTHRHGPGALARIAQACSWAGPQIEVIIRDNSGNAEKRAMIAQLRRDNCRIVSVDSCPPIENFSELFKLATGDFVFCIGDDDMCLDRAIGELSAVIEQHGKDPSIVGVNGSYAIETSRGTSIAHYNDLDSDDVMARVATLLQHTGPNILFYSALRRSVVERLLSLFGKLPYSFSFHDQIWSLFYLLNGKFLRMSRLFYVYEMGPWETSESSQKRDADFLKAAGLDLALNKLLWLLCGFEGSSLVMHADVFPQMPVAQRQKIADSWFAVMFNRFRLQQRMGFESPIADEAEKLCQKFRGATGQMTFNSILADVSTLIALSSPAHAQKYFEYWAAIINSREPALRKTGS